MIKAAIAVFAFVGALWVLHPWTVRPIGEPAASPGGTGGAGAVDPAAFATDLWRGALIPALTSSAVDARTLLDALTAPPSRAPQRFGREDGSGSWYVTVRGTGRVISVVRETTRGAAAIDVPPYDGRPDLSLQLGPGLNGSGLRDATPLAPFSAFTNQLQYADVANALNARADADVLAPIRPKLATGLVITFVAVGGRPVSNDPLSPLVPVQLSIGDRRE